MLYFKPQIMYFGVSVIYLFCFNLLLLYDKFKILPIIHFKITYRCQLESESKIIFLSFKNKPNGECARYFLRTKRGS